MLTRQVRHRGWRSVAAGDDTQGGVSARRALGPDCCGDDAHEVPLATSAAAPVVGDRSGPGPAVRSQRARRRVRRRRARAPHHGLSQRHRARHGAVVRRDRRIAAGRGRCRRTVAGPRLGAQRTVRPESSGHRRPPPVPGANGRARRRRTLTALGRPGPGVAADRALRAASRPARAGVPPHADRHSVSRFTQSGSPSGTTKMSSMTASTSPVLNPDMWTSGGM